MVIILRALFLEAAGTAAKFGSSPKLKHSEQI